MLGDVEPHEMLLQADMLPAFKILLNLECKIFGCPLRIRRKPAGANSTLLQ